MRLWLQALAFDFGFSSTARQCGGGLRVRTRVAEECQQQRGNLCFAIKNSLLLCVVLKYLILVSMYRIS
jgi:hypothetical protein